MNRLIFIATFFVTSFSIGQVTLTGLVKNDSSEPIFAANVYLHSTPEIGVTTGFDGKFSIEVPSANELIVISYIGYEPKNINLKTIDITKPILIILVKNNQVLDEIVLTAVDPISEQFSVTKLEKLDIYLNPVAQGDPLKAITTLPASTTTNETANPSLRGSSADRSRVVLNGVPVYNPVRASQLNNQGFFSLFNTEIVDKMYVYASNPPLTYGNTSAGLVEIETIKNINNNQLQLSASLASTGFFLTQEVKKEVSFLQMYANHQFSEAFTGIQKDKLSNIQKFNTDDAGIIFSTKIGKQIIFNSFNYLLLEKFKGYSDQFTYNGEVKTDNKRMFNINTLKYFTKNGVLSLKNGINNAKQNYGFGAIKSENIIGQLYTAIDYKWISGEKSEFQFGISYDHHKNKFKDSIPEKFYAISPDATTIYSKTNLVNSISEAYVYHNWDINNQLTLSSGVRKNLPSNNQKDYLSTQLGIKYSPNNKNSFLLSAGNYNNYSIPNYYSKAYYLLGSNQIAFDYTLKIKNFSLSSAVYYKKETGEQDIDAFLKTDDTRTLGVELFLDYDFSKYYSITFANSFLDQYVKIGGEAYPGQKDFKYLVKTTFQYNNPRFLSVALTFFARPGSYYTETSSATLDNEAGYYQPLFNTNFFESQYDNYKRLDLGLSKVLFKENKTIIFFLSVNNFLNSKNQSNVIYNADYSNIDFDLYSQRTLYFGTVWQWNY